MNPTGGVLTGECATEKKWLVGYLPGNKPGEEAHVGLREAFNIVSNNMQQLLMRAWERET